MKLDSVPQIHNGIHQIKASAGSGKTYTLINVLLNILKINFNNLESNLFQNLLAITFTNASAQDLKDKLFERLKNIALEIEKNENWTKQEAEQALNILFSEYSSINIRTIDSFLHLLLRQNRIDVDLPLNFKPVFDEDTFFNPLLDDLAKLALEEFEKNIQNSVIYTEYKNMYFSLYNDIEMQGFLGYDIIREIVVNICTLLLNADKEERSHFASSEELQKQLEEIKNKYLANIRKIQEITEKLTVHLNFKKAIHKVQEEDLLYKSAFFSKNSLEDCVTGKNSVAITNAMEKIYEDLKISHTNWIKTYPLLKDGIKYSTVIPIALKTLDLIDYAESSQEQVLATRVFLLLSQMVKNEANIATMSTRMDSMIKYLLIDEFQDTNRIQWEVIEPFLKEAIDQYNGLFTFVGDIKQAIYSWRGGDSTLFDEIIEEKKDTTCTTLKCNWRSKKNIVDFNNSIFQQLQNEDTVNELEKLLLPEELWGKTPFIEKTKTLFADVTQIPMKEEGGKVEIIEIHKKKNNTEYYEAVKPQLLKAIKTLNSNFPYKDITILVRDNKTVSLVSAWLSEEKIPLITEGSLLLAENYLIKQIISFLQFIDNSKNELSFWHVIGFKGILPISETSSFISMVSQMEESMVLNPEIPLKTLIEEDYPEIWEEVEKVYKHNQEQNAYIWITLILSEFKLLERFSESSGYLLRLQEYAGLLVNEGINNLTYFLIEWEKIKENESLPLPEGINALRIQTIHKSKGAQYPAVILWNDAIKKNTDKSLQIYHNKDNKTFIARNSLVLGESYLKSNLTNALEILNILYVAFTRAKESLTIISHNTESSTLALLLKNTKNKCSYNEEDNIYSYGQLKERKINSKDTLYKIPTLKYHIYEPEFDLTEIEESPLFENKLLEPRLRGIIFHKALEIFLELGNNSNKLLETIVSSCVNNYPLFLNLQQREILEKEILDALNWFMNLDFPLWSKNIFSELQIFTESGKEKRLDLMLKTNEKIIIIDFKTGKIDPNNIKQLEEYNILVKKVYTEYAVEGFLCYVDTKQLISVNA